MRKHTITSLLVPIVVAWVMVTSPILGWRPALAEKAEPTLRELMEKRGKKDRIAEQDAPGSRQQDIPDDAFGRGVPRSSVEGFWESRSSTSTASEGMFTSVEGPHQRRSGLCDAPPEPSTAGVAPLHMDLRSVRCVDVVEILNRSPELTEPTPDQASCPRVQLGM